MKNIIKKHKARLYAKANVIGVGAGIKYKLFPRLELNLELEQR